MSREPSARRWRVSGTNPSRPPRGDAGSRPASPLLRVLQALVLASAFLFAGPGCGGEDSLFLPDPSNVRGTAGTVVGTVSASGTPVAGAQVSTDPGGATASTDATGAFTLSGVLPGVVTVIVQAGGYITAYRSVVVLAERITTANVALLPASGTGNLSGQATDGRFGLAEVTVSTVPVSQTRVTTSDGRYSLTGLAPGQYTVQARRLGYDRVSRVVQVLEGRTTVQDFALGARTDGIIDGTVTDSFGSGVANAAVDLFYEGDVITSFTDSFGRYSFLTLTTGFYVLSVQAAGFLPGSKGLEVRGGSVANGDIVVYRTSTATPVPGSIAGTLYDQDDLPVAGITVTPSVATTPASVLTGADGRFLFRGVPTGSVTVTATQTSPPVGGPTYQSTSVTVTVGSAQTVDASMHLEEI